MNEATFNQPKTPTKRSKCASCVLSLLVLILMIPSVIMLIYGGIKSVNLDLERALYGGIATPNGKIFSDNGDWQATTSRSICALQQFISCHDLQNGLWANETLAINAEGDILDPSSYDPHLGHYWFPEGALRNYMALKCLAGSSVQFDELTEICQSTGSYAMPVGAPVSRIGQIFIAAFTGSLLLLSGCFTVGSTCACGRHRGWRVFNIALGATTFTCLLVNIFVSTNLLQAYSNFYDCKSIDATSYTNNPQCGQAPTKYNTFSGTLPTCVEAREFNTPFERQVALYMAPGPICWRAINGENEDSLVEQLGITSVVYIVGASMGLLTVIISSIISSHYFASGYKYGLNALARDQPALGQFIPGQRNNESIQGYYASPTEYANSSGVYGGPNETYNQPAYTPSATYTNMPEAPMMGSQASSMPPSGKQYYYPNVA